MSWETFLADRVHFNLYASALVHMPTIKLIRRFARPGESILEAGCGSGRTSLLLADMGYRVTCLDRSWPLLGQLVPATTFFPTLQPVRGDLSALPFKDKHFSVVCSIGVLEHFSREAIVRLLAEQRRVAHRVLVDVPNDRCEKQSYGDEHFYPDDTWRVMLAEAGLSVERALHRGLDRGRYVGNCSVFLAADAENPRPVEEIVDVYDYY